MSACACGCTCAIEKNHVKVKARKTPGRKVVDLTGQRVGNVIVLGRSLNRQGNHYLWDCKCDCGVHFTRRGSALLKHSDASCGCSLRKRKSRPRQVPTPDQLNRKRLRSIWGGMRERCCNPKSTGLNYYGGRGIAVYQPWLDDFTEFHVWALANCYEPHLTIDRIDTNGNYHPRNCRWITNQAQQRNRRSTLLNEMQVSVIKARLAKGEKTQDLAKEYDVNGYVIYSVKIGVTWKDVEPAVI